MELIDKSAIVAEIKRFRKSNEQEEDKNYAQFEFDVSCGYDMALDDVEKFINTLELKEVDLKHLEREVEDFCYKFDDRKDKWYDMTPHDKNIMTNPTWGNFAIQLAKHFFKLGLKAAQKGE